MFVAFICVFSVKRTGILILPTKHVEVEVSWRLDGDGVAGSSFEIPDAVTVDWRMLYFH